MPDPNSEIAILFKRMMMSISGEQRLRMGCSMFDAAKRIACDSILASHPDITDAEMKREISLRFYGHEFSR
jgi:hypothetical protein